MPLLLLDLDNTLVDRAAAFRSWAQEFSDEHGEGSPEDVAWLVAADGDGYEPRDRLSRMVRERFRLGDAAARGLDEALRRGMADRLAPDPVVDEALVSASEAGWTPFVVTNGRIDQQERKLRITGLADQVAGWVVSEAVGVKKPDERIFLAAAEASGLPLDGAWMVGDSASADIAGACRLGIRSVWLHRGRAWEEAFAPTLIAADLPGAIRAVLHAEAGPDGR